MKSILMVGLSTYDITVPMDGPLVENQKYHLHVKQEGGGGPAFNAAYLCAKWGASVYLRTRIGNDPYGDRMHELMLEAGIHDEEVLRRDEFHTPYSYIYINSENGNRTIMNFRDDPETRSFSFPDHGIGVILADGHEKQLSLDAFRQYPDAVRVLDAGNFRKPTLELAEQVDYLVSSQVFAEGYTGRRIDVNDEECCRSVMEAMEGIHHNTVVITLGGDGLLYRVPEENGREDAGMVRRMEAFPARAVDTTGAGDIFHGAFCYCLSLGMALEDILTISSLTSAISVEKEGSQTSIPDRETVWKRAREESVFVEGF